MSFSDDRDTAQLISTADTDTICVFIDNGRVVNSSGRPRQLAMELDPQQPGPQQLEAVWSLVTSLAQPPYLSATILGLIRLLTSLLLTWLLLRFTRRSAVMNSE